MAQSSVLIIGDEIQCVAETDAGDLGMLMEITASLQSFLRSLRCFCLDSVCVITQNLEIMQCLKIKPAREFQSQQKDLEIL